MQTKGLFGRLSVIGRFWAKKSRQILPFLTKNVQRKGSKRHLRSVKRGFLTADFVKTCQVRRHVSSRDGAAGARTVWKNPGSAGILPALRFCMTALEDQERARCPRSQGLLGATRPVCWGQSIDSTIVASGAPQRKEQGHDEFKGLTSHYSSYGRASDYFFGFCWAIQNWRGLSIDFARVVGKISEDNG